ncbi:MAG: glutamyl-tRNA synthetase, partial [Gammaproteobacteria bacterium]|nr:glutamyl-tRNA synthetase [Gammaproteobacteria bacterium]
MTIGNARTALFSALLAWHQNGVFLLRIEDTDLARSQKEFQAELEKDLKWLGLAWQEGVEVGGAYGPYCQSERFDLYEQYYQK